MGSDLGVFGKGKRVLHVDSKIAHRILDLAMTEKDLDCSQIAGRPVDDRCLRSPERVGAILAPHQTDPCHPFVDNPSILPRAQAPIVINSAGEHIIVQRAASAYEPCQQVGPSILQQFELNGPACLLLHDDWPSLLVGQSVDIGRAITAPGPDSLGEVPLLHQPPNDVRSVDRDCAPDTLPAPSIGAVVDRRVRPILRWAVPPTRADPQHVDYPRDHTPVAHPIRAHSGSLNHVNCLAIHSSLIGSVQTGTLNTGKLIENGAWLTLLLRDESISVVLA